MLATSTRDQFKWRCVLTDSWFSSAENMKYIHATLKKYFILDLKSNRDVALSLENNRVLLRNMSNLSLL